MISAMHSDRNRSPEIVVRPRAMADRMIINSRSPSFALTTSLSSCLTGVLCLSQGAWGWCLASTLLSISMGAWQARISFHAPLLTLRGTIAHRYREGTDEAVFLLGDMKIIWRDYTTDLAFFVAGLIGFALVASGLSNTVEELGIRSLSSTQRLLMIGSGLWFSGVALSIAHLEFPRRKLILGASTDRPEIMFVADRRQRCQLEFLVRAVRLREVMQNVGLGIYEHTKDQSISFRSNPREDGVER